MIEADNSKHEKPHQKKLADCASKGKGRIHVKHFQWHLSSAVFKNKRKIGMLGGKTEK